MTIGWVISFSLFQGEIDNHYLSDKLLQFTRSYPFIFPRVTSTTPLKNAALVFSDGSSSGIAAYVINSQSYRVQSPFQSAQLVELFAIIRVFKTLDSTPFNLYTDSTYVAFSVPLLETVPHIKPSTNAVSLFQQLQNLHPTTTDPLFYWTSAGSY